MADRPNIKQGQCSQKYFDVLYYYYHKKLRESDIVGDFDKDAIDYWFKYLSYPDKIKHPDKDSVLQQMHLDAFTKLLSNEEWRKFQIYFYQRNRRGFLDRDSKELDYKKTYTITVNKEQYDEISGITNNFRELRCIGTGGKDGSLWTQADSLNTLLNPPSKSYKDIIESLMNTDISELIMNYSKDCYDDIMHHKQQAFELNESSPFKVNDIKVYESIAVHMNAKSHNNPFLMITDNDIFSAKFVKWTADSIIQFEKECNILGF
jgi:hypothetical protein